jgi:hypothetical protein
VKTKYGDRATLLYTDTDSLLMHIETEDIDADIAADPDEYDTPDDHPLHSTRNKKVLGKMKDECTGVPVAEIVGLRPKMYSILKSESKDLKKAKGVKKNVVVTTDTPTAVQVKLIRKKGVPPRDEQPEEWGAQDLQPAHQ